MGYMKKSILFDIQEQELCIYVFTGKDHSLSSSHSVPFAKDYSFILPEEFKSIDEAYLSLPLHILNFRLVELPFSDKKKVLELLPFELDGIILDGSGSVVFDACLIGNENDMSTVLVAYIRKEILAGLLAKFRSRGIDPRVVLSLETRHLIEHASVADFADQILTPLTFSDEDRIETAAKEMQNPTVDFRKAEFIYTADTVRLKKSLRITAVFAALILILFITQSTLSIMSSGKEIRAIKEERRKAYQAIFPGEKKITSESYQLKAHLKGLKEKEILFLGTSPLQVLLKLAKASSPGASLNEITVERDIIILKGECASLSDVQEIKNRFDEFLIGSSITDTKPASENKISFTITSKGIKI
jgi:type II secretory pathway component PulL